MYVYTYVEVTQGAISMEQNMRFGLILGLLAILKKDWSDYGNFGGPVFSCFHSLAKKPIVAYALKCCIISLFFKQCF